MYICNSQYFSIKTLSYPLNEMYST
uniref:Uncharacterized protein n=1 Tax=Anguilla anguilla TaxID=7936 RepID=A0A0E9U8S9_ANGAN